MSRDAEELWLGLIFEWLPWFSQPTSKPLPENSPDFLFRDYPQGYEELRAELAGLSLSVVQP